MNLNLLNKVESTQFPQLVQSNLNNLLLILTLIFDKLSQ
jgi:hypothetical protein